MKKCETPDCKNVARIVVEEIVRVSEIGPECPETGEFDTHELDEMEPHKTYHLCFGCADMEGYTSKEGEDEVYCAPEQGTEQ